MQPSKFFDRAAGARIVRTATLVNFAAVLVACQDSLAPQNTAAPETVAAAVSTASKRIADEYIVVLDASTTDVTGRANALLKAHGGILNRTYSHALKGFSAHMSAAAAAQLSGAD